MCDLLNMDRIQKLLHIPRSWNCMFITTQLNLELNPDSIGTIFKMRAFCGSLKTKFGFSATPWNWHNWESSWNQLNNITRFIWDMEENHNLDSSINAPAGLFTMPLSYLHNLEDQRLDFIEPMYLGHQLLDFANSAKHTQKVLSGNKNYCVYFASKIERFSVVFKKVCNFHYQKLLTKFGMYIF